MFVGSGCSGEALVAVGSGLGSILYVQHTVASSMLCLNGHAADGSTCRLSESCDWHDGTSAMSCC